MSNETSNRPTHVIWQVIGEGDKPKWTRIGAAWLHSDGRGLNLSIDAMLMTGRIVIREARTQAGDMPEAETTGSQVAA